MSFSFGRETANADLLQRQFSVDPIQLGVIEPFSAAPPDRERFFNND
jgi:hypothetical protein